jgi:hypothetical protein
VGVAVNVTEVPAHTGFADAPIDMVTGSTELTTMVIAFEVAGFPVGHAAFDVKIQVITCPLIGT